MTSFCFRIRSAPFTHPLRWHGALPSPSHTTQAAPGFGLATAPPGWSGSPIQSRSSRCFHPALHRFRSLSSFTSTHTVISRSHVAARCTDARGLPFVLSAGDLPIASKCRHPLVRTCAVQLVPTTLAMSTWFFEWKPPAARVPTPLHARHSTTPTPSHALHVLTALTRFFFVASIGGSTRRTVVGSSSAWSAARTATRLLVGTARYR